MNQILQGLIFDCDGVLVDSETIACRVVAERLSDAGFLCMYSDMKITVTFALR